MWYHFLPVFTEILPLVLQGGDNSPGILISVLVVEGALVLTGRLLNLAIRLVSIAPKAIGDKTIATIKFF